MNNPKISFAPLVALYLISAILLNACSKPEPADVNPVTSTQYRLKDVRYFFNQGDRVDTLILQLKASSVQNASTVFSAQQVEESFGELVKTSRFIVDSTSQVPKDVDLSKFEVSVPQHWYGNSTFGRSIEAFSFSATEQQKPYGFAPKRTVTVEIPPKSKLDISRQITAYQLDCSFDGILENTTTGQLYPLKGKWKGLLQYANPSTTVKQSAL
ncbi:MAG: hypothetical protein EOO39_05565 [Cytophagaceae bacterium]|nr:MAG: hypothetical protein EOO39_05565 [Cytophagaceae bacterium]